MARGTSSAIKRKTQDTLGTSVCKIHEAWEHVRYEALEAKEHVGHKASEAQEHVGLGARRAREHTKREARKV